jgi:hypothetical protein
MRTKALILLVLAAWCAGGCRISRHIVDVEPPAQPSLRQLEQHLDYTDPDAGRDDYIFVE